MPIPSSFERVECDLYCDDSAEFSGADDFLDLEEFWVVSPVLEWCECSVGFFGGLDHAVDILGGSGQGFFADDVLAGAECLDGVGGVEVVGAGDDYQFDVAVICQAGKIGVSIACEFVGGVGAPGLVGVTDGDYFEHVGHVSQGVDVDVPAASAESGDADVHGCALVG